MPVIDPKIVCVGSGLGQKGSTWNRGACTVCADDATETERSATRGSSAFDFIVLSRVMTQRRTADGRILRRFGRVGQRLALVLVSVFTALVARPAPIDAHE